MKSIKQQINDWFEDRVDYDADKFLYNDEDFWQAWQELETDIDNGGIQWCFEWHMDMPELTEKRSEFIKKAINNYIFKHLRDKYVNYKGVKIAF